MSGIVVRQRRATPTQDGTPCKQTSERSVRPHPAWDRLAESSRRAKLRQPMRLSVGADSSRAQLICHDTHQTSMAAAAQMGQLRRTGQLEMAMLQRTASDGRAGSCAAAQIQTAWTGAPPAAVHGDPPAVLMKPAGSARTERAHVAAVGRNSYTRNWQRPRKTEGLGRRCTPVA
jgi:hypothetical protein